MTVRYIHQSPGFYGNILWDERHPMHDGAFPKSHPCAPGDKFELQMGHGASLEAFRERGYWASCFPEGDGITMKAMNGQTREQVVRDIEECFGWEVKS
jgi:hypothetical protein